MSKILIAYWSSTGHTENMANAIATGIREAGSEVDILHVSNQPDVNAYDAIAFGCPAMGAEELEEGEFEPYFMRVEGSLGNKKVALFGSYGWGSGEWMQAWEERVLACGATLFSKGLIINEDPDEVGLMECKNFGSEFATF